MLREEFEKLISEEKNLKLRPKHLARLSEDYGLTTDVILTGILKDMAIMMKVVVVLLQDVNASITRKDVEDHMEFDDMAKIMSSILKPYEDKLPKEVKKLIKDFSGK